METADLSHHISRRFNEDLERVRNKVLTMGGMVEQQLANAVTALIEGDSSLGVSVGRDDFKVNGMEVSIDEECSRILATRSWCTSSLKNDWLLATMTAIAPAACAFKTLTVKLHRPRSTRAILPFRAA